MKIILLIFGIFGVSVLGRTQIQVQNTLNPQQIVDNILVGSGVTAFNVTMNGSAANTSSVQPSVSYFNQNGTSFPITDGVLLTSGGGGTAVGPNGSGSSSSPAGTLLVNDADMTAIAAAGVTNGVVLEFDFVATGNLLEFNYIFGSEEYPEFVNAGYNDVFGFFLSGPGISGPYQNAGVNLAVIPGTTIPITIDNVNANTNSTYYVNNVNGASYGTAIQYDGTTTLMTAFSDLICGSTYHIKLGVANVGDQGWDSGVFIEGGSFTTNPISFTFNSYTLNKTVFEGCNQLGTIMFTRDGCGNENDTIIGYIEYGGNALNGIDYNLLGDSVVLLPGVDTLFWQIIPIEDFIVEGVDTVNITLTTITNLGDTLYGYGTFYIEDVPELFALGNDVLIQCYTDSTEITASANGGFAPYSYEWDNGDLDSTTNVFIPGNGVIDYYVTVTDACGYEDTDTVTVTMNQTLAIDSIMMLTPASCLPEGSLVTTSFPFGAIPANPGNPGSIDLTFDWTYEGDTNFVFPDQSSLNNLYGGWYYLELTDNVIGCTVYDSVFIETINTPQAVASLSPGFGCSPTDVVLSNSSNNSTTYTWNFGNGNTATVTNQNDITQTYYSDGNIMLVASNGIPACNDTTFLFVDIVVCGCTDPTALNYDPNAVIDAGNCTYPVPTVVAPNVITANGDNINAFFFLQTEHAAYIKLTILNRWGNVMFEGEGDQLNQPMWNGKNKQGIDVPDGTYFYRYLVKGTQGDQIDGHGFLEVVH